jgi:hypothetical protein
MGVEIISTVLVPATAEAPAGPYDLTTLADLHAELNVPTGDTTNDTQFSKYITTASAMLQTYCNRVFAVEGLQDQIYPQLDHYPWQVPGGLFPLQLSRWPLANATPVAFTGNTYGTTTVDTISSMAGLVEGALVFASDGSIPAGTTIESVGTDSITLSNPTASSETGLAMNTGLQVVQQLTVGMTQTLVYGVDFTVDAKRGWLIRLNKFTGVAERWEPMPTTVQYQAGYETIPGDVEEACLRLCTARWWARGRDPSLRSQTQPTLGTREYWVGAVPGQNGALPPEIEALVAPYRVPVTA